MAHKDPKWPEMIHNGLNWFKIYQNCAKLFNILPMFQNGSNGQKKFMKFSYLVQNSPKMIKMVQNGIRWSYVI